MIGLLLNYGLIHAVCVLLFCVPEGPLCTALNSTGSSLCESVVCVCFQCQLFRNEFLKTINYGLLWCR